MAGHLGSFSVTATYDESYFKPGETLKLSGDVMPSDDHDSGNSGSYAIGFPIRRGYRAALGCAQWRVSCWVKYSKHSTNSQLGKPRQYYDEEARCLRLLEGCGHTPRVFARGTLTEPASDESVPAIVMEHITDGVTIKKLRSFFVKRYNAGLPSWAVARIGLATIQALDPVWKQMVHRDVSPGNLLIRVPGGAEALSSGEDALRLALAAPFVYVIDFGQAAAIDVEPTRIGSTNARNGSAAFLAPETLNVYSDTMASYFGVSMPFTPAYREKALRPTADYWSIGALLYYLAANDNPPVLYYEKIKGIRFQGESAEDAALGKAISTLTNPNPDKRDLESVKKELAKAAGKWRPSEPSDSRLKKDEDDEGGTRPRRKAPRALLAIVVALGLALSFPDNPFAVWALGWVPLGNVKAAVARGHLNGEYYLGRDVDKAASLFEEAGNATTAADWVALGDAYYKDDGTVYSRPGEGADVAKAAGYYQRAADKGDVRGEVQLGKCYRYGGDGFDADDARAVALFQKAADQGDAYAQGRLASAYYNAVGNLDVDYGQAVTWAQRAADKGNAFGQQILALCYYYGDGGLGQDYAKATSLARASAEQGEQNGEYLLGRLYLEGRVEDGGDSQAHEWLRKSADQGQPYAQDLLGTCYMDGKGGVAKNYKQAADWFEKAADQGVSSSQGYLSYLYYGKFTGVTRDYEKAASYASKAASQGDRNGEYILGMLYYNGEGGLGKSEIEAKFWLKRSADQGNEDAKTFLASLG